MVRTAAIDRAGLVRREQYGPVMTHRNVEILIGKLATDAALGRRFANDPAAVLNELERQGLELTAVEIDALSSTDVAAIQTITRALDRRIRKAALGPNTTEENHMYPSTVHGDTSRGERMIAANGVEIATEA